LIKYSNKAGQDFLDISLNKETIKAYRILLDKPPEMWVETLCLFIKH
jgi:hypothetical protein